MNPDVELSNAAKLLFADAVLARVRTLPLGTLPKRELDQAIFEGLVAAGIVDVRASHFDLARQLAITPAKVRSFVYAHRLALAGEAQDIEILLDRVKIVSLDLQGDAVLNVEDAYDRDVLLALLKRHDVYSDTSHNRERVILPAGAFLDVVDAVFGAASEGLGAQAVAMRKQARGGQLRDAVLKGVGKAA